MSENSRPTGIPLGFRLSGEDRAGGTVVRESIPCPWLTRYAFNEHRLVRDGTRVMLFERPFKFKGPGVDAARSRNSYSSSVSFLQSPFPISQRPLTPRGIVPIPSAPPSVIRRSCASDERQSRGAVALSFCSPRICIAPCNWRENTDVGSCLCHWDVCITRAVYAS